MIVRDGLSPELRLRLRGWTRTSGQQRTRVKVERRARRHRRGEPCGDERERRGARHECRLLGEEVPRGRRDELRARGNQRTAPGHTELVVNRGGGNRAQNRGEQGQPAELRRELGDQVPLALFVAKIPEVTASRCQRVAQGSLMKSGPRAPVQNGDGRGVAPAGRARSRAIVQCGDQRGAVDAPAVKPRPDQVRFRELLVDGVIREAMARLDVEIAGELAECDPMPIGDGLGLERVQETQERVRPDAGP